MRMARHASQVGEAGLGFMSWSELLSEALIIVLHVSAVADHMNLPVFEIRSTLLLKLPE